MKPFWESSSARLVLLAVVLQCHRVPAVPPPLLTDPTGARKLSGLPFAELSAETAAMKQLAILPEACQVVSGTNQISGPQKPAQPGRVPVKIIPNAAGHGATTWWEKFNPAWPDDMKWALDQTAYLSLCHGWSSGPTTYLTENVLGVRPTSAGFATAEIAPQLGDLQWAEGDVPTPNGVIHIRVERNREKLKCVVKLPPNVVAAIRLGGRTLTADHAGTFRLTEN